MDDDGTGDDTGRDTGDGMGDGMGDERARRADRFLRTAERADGLGERLRAVEDDDAGPSAVVTRARETARRSLELAQESAERAAHGMRQAADAHERAAAGLEELAARRRGQEQDDLLGRARRHRAQGAGDRAEAAADQQAGARIARSGDDG
ncbi:hypothetical protein KIH74_21770 [Kineosporia sp. J2-2]|uniref:Uncharacterized protein n=1 Tax=Kineosporia corallincola TaxID=2835133 RepID=A0ABS5TKF4_9ACTN|nr:hypothetical protein [Kineosporia corallincola]MBT0771582.1 hypothetical protein [Kineosporia corallincola]